MVHRTQIKLRPIKTIIQASSRVSEVGGNQRPQASEGREPQDLRSSEGTMKFDFKVYLPTLMKRFDQKTQKKP